MVSVEVKNEIVEVIPQNDSVFVEVVDGTVIVSGGDGVSAVYLRIADGHLQYSENNETWTNLTTFQNGKDGKDGKDGDPGYTPQKGVDYFDGQKGNDGVGISKIEQTTTSSADGGNNVFTVTLTNGNTASFNVKNGSKGSPGNDGSDASVTITNIKNALGYTPAKESDVSRLSEQKVDKTGITLGKHTDGLFYIFVNGSPVGSGVEITGEVIEGDVIGTIDENNNIILSGNILDGTYTLKYLNEDGTYTEVGSLVVGEIVVEPTFTNFADPTSADWQEGKRLSGNIDGTTTLTGGVTTNYIAVQVGDTVEVEGINIKDSNSRTAIDGSHAAIAKYSELISVWQAGGFVENVTYDNNGLTLTICEPCEDISNIRFSGLATGTSADVVVKIKRNGEWL